MSKVFPVYVSTLQSILLEEGKTYLNIDRKIISLHNEEIDYTNLYIFSYKREEFDKKNFNYTFFIDKYNLTFDEIQLKNKLLFTLGTYEKIKDFFTLGLKDISILNNKDSIGEIFLKIEDLQEIIDFVNNYNNEDFKIENFVNDVVLKVVKQHIESIDFYDGTKEKQVKILKKKSGEKISKTLGNRFFHLTLYGNNENELDIYSF